MRTAITSLLLLISIFSTAVLAQEASCLTGDPAYEIVGTFPIRLELPNPDGVDDPRKGTTGSNVVLEVFVMRSRDGQIQYSIVPNSFKFEGDPEVIDAMGTRELFRMAEQAAIAKGVMAGYTECSPDCKAVTVRVCQTACVKRIGSGLETRFEPCDPNACCVRTYQVCCPDGTDSPVTRLLSVEGAQCGMTGDGTGECESICW